ncbi:MAG: hypothetical protein V4619_01860 [Bacteroidota bacterium]
MASSAQVSKYYVISENKQILVATTEPDISNISDDAKKLFAESAIYLTIIKSVLSKSGHTITDRDAVYQLIDRSKEAAHIGSSTIAIALDKGNKQPLNEAIISLTLGEAMKPSPGTLDTAKEIVNDFGDLVKQALSKNTPFKKIAHLLFIDEYLMGIPMVTICLYWVTAKDLEIIKDIDCNDTPNADIRFNIHVDQFVFSPRI